MSCGALVFGSPKAMIKCHIKLRQIKPLLTKSDSFPTRGGAVVADKNGRTASKRR